MRNLNEAVIFNYKERGKPFIDELESYFENKKSISLKDLARMAKKYDIEIVDYQTFYDELPDLWKKGKIPGRSSRIFGLANPNTKKARLVIGMDPVTSDLLYMIKIIVAHELVHVSQSEKMRPGTIYIPPSTVYDGSIYYADKKEIMAWSKTIVDEIMLKYKPDTFEQAIKNMWRSNYYSNIKSSLKNKPKIWARYLKYIYLYFKKEFEPVEEKSDLSELRKMIRNILLENNKIKVNYAYFQKLLDMSRTDLNNRNFIQGVINSIRKAGGMATERQYAVLKRFETGDKTPYSSKN